MLIIKESLHPTQTTTNDRLNVQLNSFSIFQAKLWNCLEPDLDYHNNNCYRYNIDCTFKISVKRWTPLPSAAVSIEADKQAYTFFR